MVNRTVVEQYLRRLGVAAPEAPSVAGLKALHRAHVERVPYETLEILLGRPTTVNPQESIERILRGRGGYCFHLNGAFGTLLTALGYQVRWHVGGVQTSLDVPAGANGNHLVLTVECEEETWFVDAGLGEGIHEPLPLREGTYQQGAFTFGLAPSAAEPGGWRLANDPQNGFPGMDFRLDPAGPADFADRHRWLSTSPDSQFANFACAFRRDADGIDALRGCVLIRTDSLGRHKLELTSSADWFGALGDIFGLTLDEVPVAAREALWQRTIAVHRAWQEQMAQHA